MIKDALFELPATIVKLSKNIADSVPLSDPSSAAVTATPVVPVIHVSAQVDSHCTQELKFDGITESKGDFNAQTESDFFDLKSILSHLGKENHVRVKSFRRLGKKNPDASRPRTFLIEFYSQFDCKKFRYKGYTLKIYCSPPYISKSLFPAVQITMRKLLKLRSDVSTRENIAKKELKISNLKLLHNGVEFIAPE